MKKHTVLYMEEKTLICQDVDRLFTKIDRLQSVNSERLMDRICQLYCHAILDLLVRLGIGENQEYLFRFKWSRHDCFSKRIYGISYFSTSASEAKSYSSYFLECNGKYYQFTYKYFTDDQVLLEKNIPNQSLYYNVTVLQPFGFNAEICESIYNALLTQYNKLQKRLRQARLPETAAQVCGENPV